MVYSCYILLYTIEFTTAVPNKSQSSLCDTILLTLLCYDMQVFQTKYVFSNYSHIILKTILNLKINAKDYFAMLSIVVKVSIIGSQVSLFI